MFLTVFYPNSEKNFIIEKYKYCIIILFTGSFVLMQLNTTSPSRTKCTYHLINI